MRLEHRWIVLIWSIWTVQFLTTEADDDECTTELQVRRNTAHKASLGQELRIECPVVFCNNLPPTICWYKVMEEHICLNDNNHMKTEWKLSNPSEGISYLFFQSITSRDSGEYRCKCRGGVSHSILIDVYDMGTNDPRKTKTNDTNNQPETEAGTFLMSIYPAAGIGSFVVLVFVISITGMRGCKGKSRTDAAEIQNSPRGSPAQAEELSSVVYMVGQEGKLPGR